jgi:hypothetical protein
MPPVEAVESTATPCPFMSSSTSESWVYEKDVVFPTKIQACRAPRSIDPKFVQPLGAAYQWGAELPAPCLA